MTGLVDTVRGMVDEACVVSGLRKKGCRVSLRDAPEPHLIVDFDSPGSPRGASPSRCDYLFVAGAAGFRGLVAVLELKRGKVNAATIVAQLQAGAEAAEQLVPVRPPARFRPVAVFGGALRKAERNALKERRNRVRFHAAAETVRLMRCGGRLVQGLR